LNVFPLAPDELETLSNAFQVLSDDELSLFSSDEDTTDGA